MFPDLWYQGSLLRPPTVTELDEIRLVRREEPGHHQPEQDVRLHREAQDHFDFQTWRYAHPRGSHREYWAERRETKR